MTNIVADLIQMRVYINKHRKVIIIIKKKTLFKIVFKNKILMK